jgi:hypothetical protein
MSNFYEVSENPSLRNLSLPSTNGERPLVGLDLRYLVSFYGRGTLPHDHLQATINELALRSTSDPAGEAIGSLKVRLSLLSVDLEEMHKIWEMMRLRHAPSLIYGVSGLII